MIGNSIFGLFGEKYIQIHPDRERNQSVDAEMNWQINRPRK